ncbi:MAG: methyltransferase [Rhodospirillales bacterium]|nr:MAG: methyltransferase [Rhodospirillales bacterium]
MDALTVPSPTANAALDGVVAPINYLVPGADKPFSYTYEPPPGTPWRNTVYAPFPMAVRDARALAAAPTLDDAGFTLVGHDSAVRDFHDEAGRRAAYDPEVERLVAALTGAAKVVVFDHTLRDGRLQARAADGVREPVKRAHNDYTPRSAPQRVRDILSAEEAGRRLRDRYAIVNVWRPIGGVVEESPLAIADARSVAFDDFVASDLIYRDRRGETYGVRHNPAHRWYHYPSMRPDEALVFKCFDSAEDGRARWTAHAAFDDPTTSPSAAPRRSVETRTLAFWEP